MSGRGRSSSLGRHGRRQAGFTLVELVVAMFIMGIVSTMLVGTWISLQRSADFSEQKTQAAAAGRDALDRVSSELRDAQPCASSTASPFCSTLSSPYVNDSYDCTFYTPYNNPNVATLSGTNGLAQSVLTSIYLDTSGTQSQKKLMMIHDTNHDGVFDTGDQVMTLATNVVNSATAVNRPIFSYVFDTNGTYSTASSITSATASKCVAVNIEVVLDTNLLSKPTYVDLVSTIRPRNASAN